MPPVRSSRPRTAPRPATEDTVGSRRRRLAARLAGAATIVAAVWAAYHPALIAPLIFDDIRVVAGNPSIEKLWPLYSSEPSPLNPVAGTPTSVRPLVNLSLALNYSLGGLDPRGYHVFSIVLHALTALLLWSVVRRTLDLEFFAGRFAGVSHLLGFATALVWALHPLDTETVIYVTQRTEGMMGFFYLATLLTSICYWTATRPAARIAWVVLATASALLGMVSKEMMASAPAMVLLYERTFVRGTFLGALRRSWPLYAGLALGWMPIVVFSLRGVRTPLAGFDQGVPAHEWWLTECEALCMYLRMVFWPWPLSLHHGITYLTSLREAWPYVAATAALVAATVVLVLRRTAAGFVGAWLLAVLSPTLLVPLVIEIAAERRMYVPLMAIVPLVIAGTYELARWAFDSGKGRASSQAAGPRAMQAPAVLTLCAAGVLALVFFAAVDRRALLFADDLALWSDAVRQYPDDAIVLVFEGIALERRGRPKEALEDFQRAVRNDPKSFVAHYNVAHARTGRAQARGHRRIPGGVGNPFRRPPLEQ